MSAERRLSASALFGKHPAFGDFVTAGELSGDSIGMMMDWLAQTLGSWRDGVGDTWQQGFDNAPPLRFWIGAALVNGQSLRGVMRPSRDRTGRRFPLVIAQLAGGAAPVTESDQTFHDRADAELGRLCASEGFEPREAAAALTRALPATPESPATQGTSFWALNPNRSPQDLLNELQATDFAHAQAGRSYWWFAARPERGMPSGVLACVGWPGPAEMGWLLAGGHIQPPPPEAAETVTGDEAAS